MSSSLETLPQTFDDLAGQDPAPPATIEEATNAFTRKCEELNQHLPSWKSGDGMHVEMWVAGRQEAQSYLAQAIVGHPHATLDELTDAILSGLAREHIVDSDLQLPRAEYRTLLAALLRDNDSYFQNRLAFYKERSGGEPLAA
jgi:hypothetical protein